MIDALFRLGYRCAYWCARAWWFVRRPRTRGAAIALWLGERVLLIRTSYRDRYSLPGGFVGRTEQARDAACREVLEEIGIVVAADRLALVYEDTLFVEHHHDMLSIFELELASEPIVRANGRELVWIGWKTAAEADALPLLSHVRAYLARTGCTASYLIKNRIAVRMRPPARRSHGEEIT